MPNAEIRHVFYHLYMTIYIFFIKIWGTDFFIQKKYIKFATQSESVSSYDLFSVPNTKK